MKQVRSVFRGLLSAGFLTLLGVSGVFGAPVRVFAAASIGEIIAEIGNRFSRETGVEVRVVIAGSATLAQQITAGAPADIYISANQDWVDFVADAADFGPGRDLFSNSLVVIAPAWSDLRIDALSDLPAALDGKRLALGDPAFVPGGIYARQALENSDLWDALKGQLAPAADVRAALRLVMAGAAPLGIVYRTDTQGMDMKTVWEIDPASHDRIAYVASLAPEAGEGSEQFFDFLGSDGAKSLAGAYGYIIGAGD